jgi:predicted dinucleotide-binding enzyme
MVGNALGTKLVDIGQQVCVGSRSANSEAGQECLRSVGGKAKIGTFADAAAKREVAARLCEWFGWKPGNIIDLGDITNSRGTEMFLALWVRLWGALGTPHFNIHVVRAK